MEAIYQMAVLDTTTVCYSRKNTANQALVEAVNQAGKTTFFVEGDASRSLTLKPCGGKGNSYMVVIEGDHAKELKGLMGKSIALHLIARG